MGYTALSLFTGAGGMDVGFSQAGVKTIWANDIDRDACKTFEKNHKVKICHGNLLGFLDEIKYLSEQIIKPDIVIGGPPCQGFSVAGKMDPNDERSKLIHEYMNVVNIVSPKVFVMENVKALATLEKWSNVRNRLFYKAEEMGYSSRMIVLNASSFGVPQRRERVFFIGFTHNLNIDWNIFYNKLEKQKMIPPTVQDVIKSLGKAGTENNKRICKAKITTTPNPILRKSPYAGMLFNGAGRPIDSNGVCSTLPATMGGNKTPIVDENQIFNNKKSWVEMYHQHLMEGGKPYAKDSVPEFMRRLTVDEAKLIQTFPENYEFIGSQSSAFKQIGNAVPCKLANAVATACVETLSHKGTSDKQLFKEKHFKINLSYQPILF